MEAERKKIVDNLMADLLAEFKKTAWYAYPEVIFKGENLFRWNIPHQVPLLRRDRLTKEIEDQMGAFSGCLDEMDALMDDLLELEQYGWGNGGDEVPMKLRGIYEAADKISGIMMKRRI